MRNDIRKKKKVTCVRLCSKIDLYNFLWKFIYMDRGIDIKVIKNYSEESNNSIRFWYLIKKTIIFWVEYILSNDNRVTRTKRGCKFS